jgi:hypothetical protein
MLTQISIVVLLAAPLASPLAIPIVTLIGIQIISRRALYLRTRDELTSPIGISLSIQQSFGAR